MIKKTNILNKNNMRNGYVGATLMAIIITLAAITLITWALKIKKWWNNG